MSAPSPPHAEHPLPAPATSELAGAASRQRFLDVDEPFRPELDRYCRSLTQSPWDAEDLVQDTPARAFATLGCLFQPPPNPRAWMFRVASSRDLQTEEMRVMRKSFHRRW